jgi:hypothetical protein
MKFYGFSRQYVVYFTKLSWRYLHAVAKEHKNSSHVAECELVDQLFRQIKSTDLLKAEVCSLCTRGNMINEFVAVVC